MFYPHFVNGFSEKYHSLQQAARTISIVSAVAAGISVCISCYYLKRTRKCMNELDASLPVIGKAAEKYLRNHPDEAGKENQQTQAASEE